MWTIIIWSTVVGIDGWPCEDLPTINHLVFLDVWRLVYEVLCFFKAGVKDLVIIF